MAIEISFHIIALICEILIRTNGILKIVMRYK